VGELIAAGVVLSGGPFGAADYLFTRLNDLSPQCSPRPRRTRARATVRAGVGGRVGAIRRASQGIFEICRAIRPSIEQPASRRRAWSDGVHLKD
jgi:hypothetical protein